MTLAIKPHQRVLFIGDSITDCGRRSPSSPIGDGYVRMVHELLMARYPAHELRIFNTGISGNTARDLAGRWGDDVLNYHPDWLSIKIGINDLHRWLSKVEGQSVSPTEFAELYAGIMARTKKALPRTQVVLVDPFYISTDAGGGWRGQVLEKLPLYIRTVHKMVKQHKARHVRTHEMFQKMLKHHTADELCPEPVHPYASGHLAIANAWVNAVGG